MSKTIRKYIESHWLIFVAKGVVALIAGFYFTFSQHDVKTLTATIGCTLLTLGLIELLNIVFRTRKHHTWGVAVVVTLAELITGIVMLGVVQLPREIPLVVLSAYTIFYGVFSVVSGFRDFANLTNKFIFVFIGILGCIVGISILGSNMSIADTSFIKLFGTYLMLRGFGLTVYGVHSRDEKLIQVEERVKAKK